MYGIVAVGPRSPIVYNGRTTAQEGAKYEFRRRDGRKTVPETLNLRRKSGFSEKGFCANIALNGNAVVTDAIVPEGRTGAVRGNPTVNKYRSASGWAGFTKSGGGLRPAPRFLRAVQDVKRACTAPGSCWQAGAWGR